jgi:hypothetical protein
VKVAGCKLVSELAKMFLMETTYAGKSTGARTTRKSVGSYSLAKVEGRQQSPPELYTVHATLLI